MSSSSPPSPPPPPPSSSSSSSSATPPVFGARDFSSEEKTNIRNLLQQRLGKEHLATRQGAGGAQLTYIEGWQTIQIANSIFGFNGWSSSVVELSPDFVSLLRLVFLSPFFPSFLFLLVLFFIFQVEETQGKFRVGVTAVVKVSLKDGTSHEDVGYGLAENPRKGIAIENAKKEAVTDARKRALRLFGNALGNCIYDKGHLKRLKTAQPEAQGYLPADTTMELMNRATTGEVENGGIVSHR
jgi:DNA repair and recombination protein RAD52